MGFLRNWLFTTVYSRLSQVKRRVYTVRFRSVGEEQGEQTAGAGDKLISLVTEDLKALGRKLSLHLVQVCFIGCIPAWKREQDEAGVVCEWYLGEELRIPPMHGKDTYAFAQGDFGILQGQIIGKIVAGVPVAEEMGVEADDQGLVCRADLGECGSNALKLRLKTAY